MPNGFPASRSTTLQFLHRSISRPIITHRIDRTKLYPYSMSANTNGVPKTTNSGVEKRKLKILMLHGYTQSGPLFHAKTRALEKLLIKAFPSTPSSPLSQTYPGGVQLSYPTAPIRLQPADIPGFNPENGKEEEMDAWGWWRRETGGERYIGLEEGLERIAETIREMGGVDGVIGFSQGAAAAGFVASLLEDERPAAFTSYSKTNAEAFPYPSSFSSLKTDLPEQGPLKFAVSYSGFYAPSELYKAFYEPKIRTKVLHVVGSLDSVVEEKRSLALVNACEGGKERVLYHPGGHFVPIGKEVTGVLVGFIRECCEVREAEEGVEKMDVPF